MDRKKKALQIGLILLGLVCFGAAGLMIKSFSGRWKDGPPSAVAGPALSFTQDRAAAESAVPVTPVLSAAAPPQAIPPERKQPWVTYVTGAVKSPGVYHLPPDSRVYHLVDSAGGMTADADDAAVNLASPLADGAHLHVPLKIRGGVSAPGGLSLNTGIPAPSESVSVFTFPAPKIGRSVNLNSAGMEELQSLPGIGPKMAESILAYRNEFGPFRSVSELMKVTGIGSKKFESIKNMIVVH